MKIKHHFLILAALILFTQCSESDNPEPIIPEDKIYEFMDIQFHLMGDSSMKISERVYYTIEYNNETEITQYMPVLKTSSINNYMTFESGNHVLEYLLRDSLLVNIPVNIIEDEIILSSDKYLFSDKTIHIPVSNFTNDTIKIAPQSNVVVQLFQVNKDFEMRFDLIYLDKSDPDSYREETKTLSGIWRGVFFDRITSKFQNKRE